MTLSPSIASLLADTQVVRHMAKGFQDREAQVETGGLITGVFAVLALVAGVWVFARLKGRKVRGKPSNNPWALFRSLCKAHGLDRRTRRLLARLARHQKLDHPARMFLEPDRLDPDAAEPRFNRTRLAAVRSVLFPEPSLVPDLP